MTPLSLGSSYIVPLNISQKLALLWKLPSFERTEEESFTFYDPSWRQQRSSQVLRWWTRQWSNLAANQNGLGSLLNKRENKNHGNTKHSSHINTSKCKAKESVLLTSSKTSVPTHHILRYQLGSLLRMLLSLFSPDLSLERQISPLCIWGAPPMH